jgi:hypothetical protein
MLQHLRICNPHKGKRVSASEKLHNKENNMQHHVQRAVPSQRRIDDPEQQRPSLVPKLQHLVRPKRQESADQPNPRDS